MNFNFTPFLLFMFKKQKWGEKPPHFLFIHYEIHLVYKPYQLHHLKCCHIYLLR